VPHQIAYYEVGTLAVDGWTVRAGDWAGPQPAQAPLRCTKCKTVHPSTPSLGLTITVLLYNGLLLCGFNVPSQWT